MTKSALETIRIGKKIGSHLLSGDVVALFGELGAGKTHFIKGLAAGVGGVKPEEVSSPSFTIINEYRGKIFFFHIDLYRLNSEMEGEELGIEEYLHGKGIAAIEWADKIPSLLPKELLEIHIQYTGNHTRSIEVIGKGSRYQEVAREMVSPKPGRRIYVTKN